MTQFPSNPEDVANNMDWTKDCEDTGPLKIIYAANKTGKFSEYALYWKYEDGAEGFGNYFTMHIFKNKELIDGSSWEGHGPSPPYDVDWDESNYRPRIVEMTDDEFIRWNKWSEWMRQTTRKIGDVFE